MKRSVFLLSLLSLLPTQTVWASVDAAERALRQGNPAEALKLIKDAVETNEVHYWRGRALLELKHYPAAISSFAKVQEDNQLYPYAAKGIIYCALRCPDTENLLNGLTTCPDKRVALLAKAAIAEYRIAHHLPVDANELKALSAEDKQMAYGLALLEAENLRNQGKYDEAIEKCRQIENSAAPTLLKDYSRILLGDIYYDSEQRNNKDSGKGEETILKFISSHPESILLEEAFRRLYERDAFITSKYARRKIEEWSDDAGALSRSLYAKAIAQHQELTELQSASDTQGRTLKNYSDLSSLPLAVSINNNQANYLIQQDKNDDALVFLPQGGREQNNAYTLFLKARMLPVTDPQAITRYLACAEAADPELQAIALSNAVHCAYKQQNKELIEQLRTGDYPDTAKRAILITDAAHIIRSAPAEARERINAALQMQPTKAESIRAALLLAELEIEENNAEAALTTLSQFPHAERKRWSSEQTMRYYGMYLYALQLIPDSGRNHKQFLEEALKLSLKKEVRTEVTFKLAEIYAEEGNLQAAMKLLENLAKNTDDANLKARALLLAGRASTQCLTLNSVKKGAELFERSAAIDSEYRFRAAILNVAVLFRINQVEEARNKLTRVIRDIEKAREVTHGDTKLAEEYAFALTVMADIESQTGQKESLLAAIETNKKISLNSLDRAWYIRIYLQRAIFCTRAGLHQEALINYENCMRELPKEMKRAKKEDVHILFLAGTGAIASLINLERWDDAATLASTIANHELTQLYPEDKRRKLTRPFRDWATKLPTMKPVVPRN